MAEGLLRQLGGDRFEPHSAGTEATRVHALAVEAMKEVGADISNHQSKTLQGYIGQSWDYVITVCDRAKESCPVFPDDASHIHWSFDDPSAATGSEADRLRVFKRVRDEIAARLRTFVVLAGRAR